MSKTRKLGALLVAMMVAAFFAVTPAAALNTSTVDGMFIIDKTSVTAGDTVNLSILGLDQAGAVDLYGEQFGSQIMAVVTSQLGTVNGGSTSPATTPLPGGTFAASVKYVALTQGVGACNITYPATVSGTDTIKILLQESFANEQGGVSYNTIASDTKTVAIAAASGSVKSLDITDFKKSGSDTVGIWANDASLAGGIDGTMTAGIAGGQVTIKANTTTASGPVTLTLYNATQTYTFTGVMSGGTAKVTINDTVTKAGTYLMKAELEGFSGNSIDFSDDDTVTVMPKTTVKKLALTSQKSIISDDDTDASETLITVTCLDEYGNATTNTSGAKYSIDVTDSAKVVSDFSIDILNGSSSGTVSIAAGTSSGDVLKLGETSLVASIPTVSTIADSDPLAIKVVDDNLVGKLNSAFSSSQVAGTTFTAFDLAVDDNLDGAYDDPSVATPVDSYVSATAATTMVVDHVVNGRVIESIEVNLAAAEKELEALFKKATGPIATAGDEYYLISDKKGRLGQVVIDNATSEPGTGDITVASPAAAMVVNGHGESVTTVGNTLIGGLYTAEIPEANVIMLDAYNNMPASTVSGTFSVTSDNGSVGILVLGDGSLVPNDFTDGTVAKVEYNPSVFTGTDDIVLSFTKPGIDPITLQTTIPEKPVLASIVPSISQTEIPVNSTVAMCVESLSQSGARYDDPSGVTVSFSGTVTPNVSGVNGGPYASGSLIDFTTETGREVLSITVGESTGDFTISFSNATGTVTAEKTFTVTKQAIVEPTPTPEGNPDTPQDTVGLGTDVDPAATTVPVAEGEAIIAPQLNVVDCTAVDQPLCYVYLPDYGFGVDLSAFVTVTCDAGVLTLDLGAIDFTGFGGNYDFYIGYVDGSDNVQYSAYRLVVE